MSHTDLYKLYAFLITAITIVICITPPHLSIPIWHRHVGFLVMLGLGSSLGTNRGSARVEGGCIGAQEGPRDCLPSMWGPERNIMLKHYY